MSMPLRDKIFTEMPSNTKLQSKAQRGGDEEPTKAYMEVRQGVRGDNEGESMKATWYQTNCVLRCNVC
jgi:hypothetical protein